MKSDDRSLDIAVIGLGQGGGNLAAQFAQFGYRAIALNTALTDLSALSDGSNRSWLSPEQRIYIGIDGYDGAGGDLNYGRECIRENAERIRQAVTEHTADADLVLITAGLGGGTGSSASELVKTLEDLNLPLIVLATLPTDNESGMAKVNAMRGANALVQMENVSWIFVDNSRLAEAHSDVPMDRYFETINSVIVEPVDALNRLNSTPELSPIRTLDGEDLRRLLLAGGVINYASVELPMLEAEAVIKCLREALQSSSIMPSGYALEQVTTIGIVIQAPDEMLARTPFAFFERLNENIKETTNGAACYLGVYRNRTKNSRAQIHLICSSQQLPNGIIAMVNDARREGGVLRDKLQQTLAPLDVSELEQFDLFRTNVRTSSAVKSRRKRPGGWSDLGDEGVEATPSVGRPRRAAPSPSPASTHAPIPSSHPAESRVQASSVPKSTISVTPTAPAAEPHSALSHARPSEPVSKPIPEELEAIFKSDAS
jgi:cell division GTPase FtsZ